MQAAEQEVEPQAKEMDDEQHVAGQRAAPSSHREATASKPSGLEPAPALSHSRGGAEAVRGLGRSKSAEVLAAREVCHTPPPPPQPSAEA